MTTSPPIDWIELGAAAPDSLSDAHLQAHHAAQVAVSATISYLAARADDSHTALEWIAAARSLVTERIAAARPFRIGLRPRDLTLLAFDGDWRANSALALDGRNASEATEWLARVAGAAGLEASRLTTRKHYSIPDHPVAHGGRFSLAPHSAFVELDRYWMNASAFLEELARATDGASPVRCWPHHFDIATLIALPPDGANASRTIGVGHSPGDEWYDEPYWYVGPSPRPPVRDLPQLGAGGRWHTTGWVGAALPASAYVGAPASEQRRRVLAFIESAVSASRTLLAADA